MIFETGIISGTPPASVTLQSLTRSDGQTITGAPPVNTALTADPYYAGGFALAFLDTTSQPAGLTYSGIYRINISGGGHIDQEIPPFPVNPTEIDVQVSGATTVSLTNIAPLPSGTTPATLFSAGNLILPSPFIGGQLGVWALPLTDATLPAPPVYQYTWTSNGTPAGPTLGLLNVPVPAMGAWGSNRAAMQRELGPTNQQIYADADNTGYQATIVALEQDAFDEADTTIQLRLATNQLANTPLTVTGAVPKQTLKRIETKLACVSLCRHRGQLAADGRDVWGAMLKIKEDEAENLINRLLLFSMNFPSDPNAIPTDDPNVTPTAGPQVVRWCQGGLWQWAWWGGGAWGWPFFGPWGSCGYGW